MNDLQISQPVSTLNVCIITGNSTARVPIQRSLLPENISMRKIIGHAKHALDTGSVLLDAFLGLFLSKCFPSQRMISTLTFISYFDAFSCQTCFSNAFNLELQQNERKHASLSLSLHLERFSNFYSCLNAIVLV